MRRRGLWTPGPWVPEGYLWVMLLAATILAVAAKAGLGLSNALAASVLLGLVLGLLLGRPPLVSAASWAVILPLMTLLAYLLLAVLAVVLKTLAYAAAVLLVLVLLYMVASWIGLT